MLEPQCTGEDDKEGLGGAGGREGGGCMEGKIANSWMMVDTQTNLQESTKKWAEKSRSKALPCMMVLLRRISSPKDPKQLANGETIIKSDFTGEKREAQR